MEALRGGHVFVLETTDLVAFFENKVRLKMTSDDKIEFFSQLIMLLRCHHPCDLSDRKLLVYGSLPSLTNWSTSSVEIPSAALQARMVEYDRCAYQVFIELYKRLQQHYLYDRSHRPQFDMRGMVGDNLILELIPAGAAIYELQSQGRVFV